VPVSSNGRPNCADLVFEGGGVKGIGLAGAYSVLEEQGWESKNVAGASAGAITAALVAAGYTAEELKREVLELDFLKFQDEGWEDRLPLFEKTVSLVNDLGIYEGNFFQEWMRKKLEAKGKRTFGDLLLDPADEDPRYRYKLHVIASDVTQRRLLILPGDAPSIGIEPDELEIAYAVRMSMSIPIFFEPVQHLNPKTNRRHTIVDGGMLSNFPVWLFDCPPDKEPDWPTFGLLLVEPTQAAPVTEGVPEPEAEHGGARELVEYLKAIVSTLTQFHDRRYVEKANFARTIPIKTLGVSTTEFDLPRERALELYESGRTAARDFLADWDFDAYIREYRSGKAIRGRRATIVAEMQEATTTASA
jgi:NTE family protein